MDSLPGIRYQPFGLLIADGFLQVYQSYFQTLVIVNVIFRHRRHVIKKAVD